MKRPPAGLCLPCEVSHVRDGDTVVVKIRDGGMDWAIRLLDCWAPEKYTKEGKEAANFCRQIIETADSLYVWIPAPFDPNMLLKNVSFDRLLGHIFIRQDKTLSEVMVEAGMATKEKQ